MSRRTLVLVGVVALALVGLTGALVALAQPAPRHPVTAATPSPSPSAAAGTPEPSPSPSPTPAAGYNHIVVIVLENHSFETVIGSPEAPYLNSLASRWSLATGYSGISHPSLPNYLALIGGSTFGIASDCTGCFLDAPSLPDRLEAAGKTWRGYMEGMPSACFTGSAGAYAQKHDPFVYFNAIRYSPARCANVVPYSQLAADFASPSTAPNFAFVTPDMCNDAHDCALSTADGWLSSQVPALMASPGFSSGRSLLVVTFDEGEGGSDRVATILAGSDVKQGFQSASVHNHYSLLRTVESLWNLQPVGPGDGSANPMSEFLAP